MKRNYMPFVIALSLLLGSCASNDKKPPTIDEYLAVHITNDNIKHFSYSAEVSKPSGNRSKSGRGGKGGGRRGDRSGGDRPDPEQMKKKMEERIDQLLSAKLEQLEYCHAGYKVLDKTISSGNAQYRGQCNDTASKEDIKKFKSVQPGSNQHS